MTKRPKQDSRGAGSARGNAAARGGGGVYVALLRGINVGGKNMLPMKILAEIFAGAGCAEVRTFIQSGNVVFCATDALAARLRGMIEGAIAKKMKLSVPVVLRSAEELREVVRSNPFLKKGADPNSLHVAFLADAPSAERIATLDAKRSPPDEFVVRGREIYLMLPNGVGKTKLSNAYFDSKLATISTGRNWRTTLALLEMAEGRV